MFYEIYFFFFNDFNILLIIVFYTFDRFRLLPIIDGYLGLYFIFGRINPIYLDIVGIY